MSRRLSIKEVCEVIGATLEGSSKSSELVCRGFQTDSREIEEGFLYVARVGEEADGHDYIVDAVRRGATAHLVEASWIEKGGIDKCRATLEAEEVTIPPELCFLSVNDTTRAFGQLGLYWRGELAVPTIAITGSNGKTTTKEIVSSLLTNLVGQGTANVKSFNNHVGMPLTILNAASNSKWLVLEAGMNHPGELKYLASISKPDIVVLLNVGGAHRGHFDSLEGLADAKCELVSGLKDDGILVVNGDDPVLAGGLDRIHKDEEPPYRIVRFGRSNEHDYYVSDEVVLGAEGISLTIHHGEEEVATKIPHVGLHNVENAVASVAIVLETFPELTLEQVGLALAEVARPPMRLQTVKTDRGIVVDDTYNANPVSVKAALITAAELAADEPFAVVLGDMLELGEEAAPNHEEIGKVAAEVGAVKLVALGEFAADTVRGASESELTESFVAKDWQSAATLAKETFGSDYRLVLVKGSRKMRMERIVEELVS